MKRDFNMCLASLGAAAPVKTLAELRAFNTAHAKRNAIKYGQANLDVSDEIDLEKDRATWEADRDKDIRLGATHGIDEVMKAQKLDALLFPGASGAGHRGQAGLSHRIVPFGLVVPVPPRRRPDQPGAFPEGFTPGARAVRRELHRHGVQRAAADRAGLRFRAGDEEAGAARQRAVATVES